MQKVMKVQVIFSRNKTFIHIKIWRLTRIELVSSGYRSHFIHLFPSFFLPKIIFIRFTRLRSSLNQWILNILAFLLEQSHSVWSCFPFSSRHLDCSFAFAFDWEHLIIIFSAIILLLLSWAFHLISARQEPNSHQRLSNKPLYESLGLGANEVRRYMRFLGANGDRWYMRILGANWDRRYMRFLAANEDRHMRYMSTMRKITKT